MIYGGSLISLNSSQNKQNIFLFDKNAKSVNQENVIQRYRLEAKTIRQILSA